MSEVRALCFDDTNKRYRALPFDSVTGGLKTDVDTSLLAQEATLAGVAANQATGNASLSSIDAKVATAANQASIQASLTTISANQATAANQATIIANQASQATAANQATGNASLASIDASSATLAGAVSAGKVQVEEPSVLQGSDGNLANSVSITAGSYSSVVDISAMKMVNVVYQDTALSSLDSIGIEMSVDGTNYYPMSELFPYQAPGSAVRFANYANLNAQGFAYMRLLNKSAADTYTAVKAMVISQT